MNQMTFEDFLLAGAVWCVFAMIVGGLFAWYEDWSMRRSAERARARWRS